MTITLTPFSLANLKGRFEILGHKAGDQAIANLSASLRTTSFAVKADGAYLVAVSRPVLKEVRIMPQVFAVTRTKGPAWNHALDLEEQDDWRGHADFMNALHAEGFVLLGGPLEGTPDVLLIIRAKDANEIHTRLSADSWTAKDLLRIKQIVAWTIRLGSIG